MSRSQFYLTLLKNFGSDWTPPTRPPNNPPPRIVNYDPETTPVAAGYEIARVLGGLARDMMENEHLTRTERLATQVGSILPMGTSLIMVPDQPPSVGWGLSSSYSLYTPDTEFWATDLAVERTTISGSGAAGIVPGTSITKFEPLPGTSIPGQFVIATENGEQVTINIPEYTVHTLEDRGIMVRDMAAQEGKELPADARFDARDHESPRDFDVGRDPGGEDHFRDYQGDIRPGREIA
jgi:hypothetical protein